MLRYKDGEGIIFKGKTHAAVVRQMRNSAWVTTPKRQYMREVAVRLRMLGTREVETGNSKDFLTSLVTTGWLRKLRGN